jgi:hypothetical protein
MQLSPEQLHSRGALWSHALQQQQVGLAVQTAAAPDADAFAAAAAEAEAAVAAIYALQHQQQQLPGYAGAAGEGLTGAWSLPGGAAVAKGPTGW